MLYDVSKYHEAVVERNYEAVVAALLEYASLIPGNIYIQRGLKARFSVEGVHLHAGYRTAKLSVVIRYKAALSTGHARSYNYTFDDCRYSAAWRYVFSYLHRAPVAENVCTT